MAGIPRRKTQADLDHEKWVFSKLGVQPPKTLADVLQQPESKVDQPFFERKDGKLVLHVEVRQDARRGWIAFIRGMAAFYSVGDTIEVTINQFKTEYGDLLKLQFSNNETFEFNFSVKM